MTRSRRRGSTSTRAEGVVTLNGTVDSAAQRDRAVQLARETEGVTSVVDELKIR